MSEASSGYSSMGMFYGFKLHAIIDEQGCIRRFLIAPANVSDQQAARALLWDTDAFVVGDKNYHGCGVYAEPKANFKHPMPWPNALQPCVSPSSTSFPHWSATAISLSLNSIPFVPSVLLSAVKLQLTTSLGSCLTELIP
jgi:transposase